MHRVHDEDYHYCTSTHEEFLQNIIFENFPIEEEEASHPTGRSMRISRSIQANSGLSEPYMVSINKLYFSKSTGINEAKVLSNRVIVPKNIQVTPGTRKNYTHFYCDTKELSFMLVAENCFAKSWTGQYDTKNKTNYAYIQETFVGNTLKCKKLNERLCIYNMVG